MNCLTYSRAILFVPVLVLGLWLSTGLATELFPVEEAKLLPFDYVNTTGMTDLDHPVSIGGQEYIAMEVSITIGIWIKL